jgi:hypothetical protein
MTQWLHLGRRLARGPGNTGLVALLNASAGAFQTLTYAGVAYLLSGPKPCKHL